MAGRRAHLRGHEAEIMVHKIPQIMSRSVDRDKGRGKEKKKEID